MPTVTAATSRRAVDSPLPTPTATPPEPVVDQQPPQTNIEDNVNPVPVPPTVAETMASEIIVENGAPSYIIVAVTVVTGPTATFTPIPQQIVFLEPTPIPSSSMQSPARFLDSALMAMTWIWLLAGSFIFLIMACFMIGLIIFTQDNRPYRLSYRPPNPDLDPIVYPGYMMASYQKKQAARMMQSHAQSRPPQGHSQADYLDGEDDYWPASLP